MTVALSRVPRTYRLGLASLTSRKGFLMSNIDIIRKFYSMPRISSADRRALLEMFDPDVRYVGVGKESACGRDAIERLFRKYEDSGRGITSLEFDIRHIAENGNTVLVDMVDTFVIDGNRF